MVPGAGGEDAAVRRGGQGEGRVEGGVDPGRDTDDISDWAVEQVWPVGIAERFVAGQLSGKAATTRAAYRRSWSTFLASAQNCAAHSVPSGSKRHIQPRSSLTHTMPRWWSC